LWSKPPFKIGTENPGECKSSGFSLFQMEPHFLLPHILYICSGYSQVYLFFRFLFSLISCVYIYQFLQVVVSLHSFLLVDREQFCSFPRVGSLQCIVTNLSVEECLIVFLLRSLAIK